MSMSYRMGMAAKLSAILGRLETWTLTPLQAITSFLAIVFIRYFLEALLESHHVLAPHLDLRLGLVDLLHVLVSWAVLYALLSLGLALITGRGQAAANRMTLAAFPLICLPPLLGGIGRLRHARRAHRGGLRRAVGGSVWRI